MNQSALSAFIWSVADLLRGNYKQSDYGKVILPFTLLRRLDCVLAPTKAAVLAEYADRKKLKIDLKPFLTKKSKHGFYNTSKLDFVTLLADPGNIRKNMASYLAGFSDDVRDIFERYDFSRQIEKLDEENLLYLIVQKFAKVNLSPKHVSNVQMGMIFEELIRKFAELSNETAGEHYTPREVIRLMVDLLFNPDDKVLTKPGTVRSMYDPTAGTGGMLSVAEEYLRVLNPDAKLVVHGQELNPESYAICKADMLIKGQKIESIALGNTLSHDAHAGAHFDYGLSNPPFGVEWKKVEKAVRDEHEKKGFHGRFGPGLPRVSDGSLLFLMHLLSKMRPVSQGGGRVGIVLNGSPLFTGNAGSGESAIRQWVLESDYLDAIVALPTDMFYNTGISTYVWILSNHKPKARKDKVILINGVDFFQKMRKSLGSKRKELGQGDIDRIVKLYGDYAPTEHSKIFDTRDFGYSTITVERPLRLNFAVSAERLSRLDTSKPLAKLGDDLDALKQALAKLGAKRQWSSREAFLKDAKKTIAAAGVTLAPPQLKALWETLGERDEHAEACTDSKGRPEPDSDLRDTENVPLSDDIQAYFEREVLPHMADAWIDHDKTRIGYEIPFTRHFYQYVPPRPLEEIDTELKALSAEIMELLGEVASA
ncbi:class I SAM-dependent DNA methyltransferase [Lysobacter sp. CFH 32150]|uniref:type I restriction-modification system subunit M n=1 Tax=Lysobacter sp. CFH 32150 TaxID=2927128 RepID=UPI001FA79D5E|nr:class I SAM-dependent DNA methyltransferase [Lysobacter sp. CFH 32150]MCI4568952.1 type I restriction-modification system subunit M [Lysobacter sp. CFH 32150]